MADHRVVAIEVATPGPRDDPHPASLQLADGRQVSAPRAITNLRNGVEAYYVEDPAGRQIAVRMAGPCPRCGLSYLRADDPASPQDQLLRLPASPFRTPFMPGR